MAGKKISELQALTEITGQEMIPVARDGQNYSVLSSLLQSGDATKLNDYAYDVSLLMGKMAVRGNKINVSTTNPSGAGYYHMDGSYTELGTFPYGSTVVVKAGKIYHFDIGYFGYSGKLTDPAVLVLFDENDKVLTAIPWAEGGFRDKYLIFTSAVKKYGVTYNITPVAQPYLSIYAEAYEIQDINDVLFNMNTEIEANTASINSYKAEISEVLVRSTIRDGKSTDLKNLISGSVFDMSGELISKTGGYYQSIDIDISKVYYLKVGAAKGDNSSLCLFDHNDKLIISTNEGIEGSFIFAGVAKIGVSCNTESDANSMVINSFDTQDLTTVINTQQGNRALYVAAGAVYNEQTGFYELNGLTDITEEQMREIYNQTNHVTRQTDLSGVFVNTNNIRTNYPFKIDGGYKQVPCYAAFVRCINIEVVAFTKSTNGVFYSNRVIYLFQYCRKLKEVIGIIRMDYVNSSEKYDNMFYQCTSLVRVSLGGVKYDISFSDSPLISLESLQYLITNAANTSAITVTVHADVYAKIQDESQADWHALIAAAQEKNITFATA